MKAGDLVRRDFMESGDVSSIGIVVKTDINMWGEEVVPTGVGVLWSDGELETVSADDLVADSRMGKCDESD